MASFGCIALMLLTPELAMNPAHIVGVSLHRDAGEIRFNVGAASATVAVPDGTDLDAAFREALNRYRRAATCSPVAGDTVPLSEALRDLPEGPQELAGAPQEGEEGS